MREESFMRHARTPVECSALESRTLLCGYHTSGLSIDPTVIHSEKQPGGGAIVRALTGLNVPAYNSFIAARATLYLDFDGDAACTWVGYHVTATPAYDIDGNASAFSATELANIKEIWSRVAEKFSPFDINVTTVNPGTLTDGKALRVVIGGDGAWSGQSCGGLSYVGSFTNTSLPNTVYAFSDNLGAGYPKFVAEAAAHESGHAFGLQHQSQFNGTTKVAEYNQGDGLRAPIMGDSYSANRGLWWKGTDSNNHIQDDLAVIGSTTNGFGLRPDDYGSNFATARGAKFVGGKFVFNGIANTTTDYDCFVVTSIGANITLKLRTPTCGAMLDGTLRLYKVDGTLVTRADTASLGETIERFLPSGKYVAIVQSHGGYGDMGQYTLYGYQTAPASAPLPATTHAFSNTKIESSLVAQLEDDAA
jgi:hypothetical protein